MFEHVCQHGTPPKLCCTSNLGLLSEKQSQDIHADHREITSESRRVRLCLPWCISLTTWPSGWTSQLRYPSEQLMLRSGAMGTSGMIFACKYHVRLDQPWKCNKLLLFGLTKKTVFTYTRSCLHRLHVRYSDGPIGCRLSVTYEQNIEVACILLLLLLATTIYSIIVRPGVVVTVIII